MKFIEAKEIFRDADSRKGLPAWTYNNDELTQLEMEQVFLRNWMFVGHVSDIPKSGDYQCFALANERAVVVRDQDGQLRAFIMFADIARRVSSAMKRATVANH